MDPVCEAEGRPLGDSVPRSVQTGDRGTPLPVASRKVASAGCLARRYDLATSRRRPPGCPMSENATVSYPHGEASDGGC